uniref:Chemokine interleukin-8-like domain-containing protein n=1 Tax=Neogobius melanostomus TaxID=47308 RepID=A0A8C6UBQ6_9GOBI
MSHTFPFVKVEQQHAIGFHCACFILEFIFTCTLSMGPSATSPHMCCFTFTRAKIAPSQILSVIKTSSRCTKKGFIVTTPTRKICVEKQCTCKKKEGYYKIKST